MANSKQVAGKAAQQRQFEDKFGFRSGGKIESLFTPSITALAWDIARGKFTIFNHPALQGEKEFDWLFFIVVRNKHASVWAIEAVDFRGAKDILLDNPVSPCQLDIYLKENTPVRRYHVIHCYELDSYFVVGDRLSPETPEYDVCLYVGDLKISPRGLDVLMASIAERTYLLLMSDCLEYCKTFVYKYFEITDKTLDKGQKKLLENLTITTIFMSQLSERSGRKYTLSGSAIRSFLGSQVGQVFTATLMSNVLMAFIFIRYFKSKFKMADSQSLRKRELEEKLGLRQDNLIMKSNFDGRVTDITWDILQGRYNVFDHPDLQHEKEENWVFFLVIHKIHAAVWAITDSNMKNVQELVSKPFITKVEIGDFIQKQCFIRRYHVIYNSQSERYYVQVDDHIMTSPEYDVCIYVGTLSIPEKTLDVIMATLTEDTYLLLQSECLEYCKKFAILHFELTEEEMTREQKATIARLTVTTNYVSQISERSGRENRSSGFSLRGLLTSTFLHVFLSATASNALLFFIVTRFLKK